MNESRYGILGLTDTLHHVFVYFTIRGSDIRVIHIRKKEKREESLCQTM
ncbi:MAG: BrnT family toxin [Bdellovibrionales bacterium]|nr:BrnT family toxin [Bdellovibrionales bacterium]